MDGLYAEIICANGAVGVSYRAAPSHIGHGVCYVASASARVAVERGQSQRTVA